MPDFYATITEQPEQVQELLAGAMEVRGAEAEQIEMMQRYLRELKLPKDVRALDVGCGTGVMTVHVADLPAVAETVGVDPSPLMIEKAIQRGQGRSNLRFQVGDARSLPMDDGSFDLVVFHTVLCHVPGCEQALAEAARVLRPGGWLAVFDGDYATTTVALTEFDPLQQCARTAIAGLVHDPWLMRRLPELVQAAGFRIENTQSHGYVQTHADGYMGSIVNRGADLMAQQGLVGADLAEALKAEAQRRSAEGRFYGHIAYGSVIARRS